MRFHSPLPIPAALALSASFFRNSSAFTSSIQSRRFLQRKNSPFEIAKVQWQSPRSNLSMHMGHSHEHNHHHHASSAHISTPKARKRRLQVVLVMAMSMLAQPLFRKRPITSSHLLVSLVASVFVYIAQPFTVSTVSRFRQWMQGISKHTPRYAPNNAADRVTVLGGVINLVLSAGKLLVGIMCHSSALIADAGHSLSDLFSDVVTLCAVSIGRLPPDEDHPFGHGKFEAIGSLFLSLTLLGTGLGIGLMANQKLVEIISLHRKGTELASAAVLPGFPALIMAAVSVISKEWLFRVTKAVGERLQSSVVIANAWHHRSDAYTSVMAVASIALARYVPGLVFCDAAAGLLVGATIGMTGAEILGQSINELTDRHPDALAQSVKAVAMSHPSVSVVEAVRARPVGSSATVDVHVHVADCSHDTVGQDIQNFIQEALPEPVPIVKVKVEVTTALRDVVDGLIDGKNGIKLQDVRTTDKNHIHVFLESNGDISNLASLTNDMVAALEKRPEVVQANVYLDLKTSSFLDTTLPTAKKLP